MQSPTAEPRMPASARGVSTQRSAPKRSRSPAVARKTPPARPTSSPRTSTSASRSISTCSASLTASTRKSSAKDPPQLGEVRGERLGRVGERVLEHEADVGGRLGLGRGDPGAHHVGRLRLDLLLELVRQGAHAAQVALVAAQALVRALLIDAVEVDVRLGVVGGRVRRGAVADRLDEGRPLAGARPGDAVSHCLVDREHVSSVDTYARDPVARRLVDERLRARLRRERRRDRPLVVVAEQHDGRAHHGGKVRALVEGALGGGAVAEEDERALRPAAQPLPPCEAGRVRDLRPDRHADRGDVVVGRVPPAGRVAAPPGEDRRRGQPAEEADRRLAVAREDPVVVLERVERSGLHGLVAPVDRVRADPALAVVDDGALVVGAQEHHRAVEREQLLLTEALDLAVRDRVAVTDHAAEVPLGRENLRHRPEIYPPADRLRASSHEAIVVHSPSPYRLERSASAWSEYGVSVSISRWFARGKTAKEKSRPGWVVSGSSSSTETFVETWRSRPPKSQSAGTRSARIVGRGSKPPRASRTACSISASGCVGT